MSKKKLRDMKQQQNEEEAKAKSEEAKASEEEKAKASEEKKAAADAVKKAAEKKGEEKGNMTLAELSECANRMTQLLKKTTDAITAHDQKLKEHDEAIAIINDYLFGDDDDADDAGEEPAVEEKAVEEVKAVEKAVETPEEPAPFIGLNDGPGYAYKFWDAKTRTYGISKDIWAAKQISNGAYDPIWVWYKNGQIDHILSDDEIRRYTPR
ncbi:hypothetical protein IKF28_02340 [Candidatus Saccharibacteria bacterium]|nr:hypothetical protein [Candidatus Saccharibacteria bacterium]MBR3122264.1 hypothetical protein [Candidatus Saccharibacteria bacterium]